MKTKTFMRFVVFPAVVLAAGFKAGVEYAKGTYVSKDRKFVEGEVVTRHSREGGNPGDVK